MRARIGAALCLAVLAGWSSGCVSQSAGVAAAAVLQAPVPTLVPSGQAMVAAEWVAGQRAGDFALIGAGSSMEPLYRAGTALVVHPTSFHMLRRGMPVVYTTARGHQVAHVLLEKSVRGWRAAGLNNAEADDTLVTVENLVGTIRHAFTADDRILEREIAMQLAAGIAPERGAATINLFH